MACKCAKGRKCLYCIEREGTTRPKPLLPPVFRCVVDEAGGARDD